MTILIKYVNILFNVPIAQSVEQLPFKQMVAGSNPAGDTNVKKNMNNFMFLVCVWRSDVLFILSISFLVTFLVFLIIFITLKFTHAVSLIFEFWICEVFPTILFTIVFIFIDIFYH